MCLPFITIYFYLECEWSPLFLQEIVENRASRDERAREKWGEGSDDLLEEKRRLLAVYFYRIMSFDYREKLVLNEFQYFIQLFIYI